MKTHLFLVVFSLGIPAFIAFGDDDRGKREQEMLRQAEELANSEKPSDRELAADILIGTQSRLTPVNLLEKLTADLNTSVRAKGYSALGVVSSTGSFTNVEARRFSEALSKEITKADIDRQFEGALADDQLALLAGKVTALNSLYFWYPLVSQIEFEIWQRDVYAHLVLRILNRSKNEQPNELSVLISGLREPEAVVLVLPQIVERLQTLSPQDCERSLRNLWHHPVFGNGRPMNANLKMLLRPISNILREKVAKGIQNEFELREIEQIFEGVTSIR